MSRRMSFTEIFIETVKKYPLLFDLSNEDYRNLKKKDKTWDLIGKELNEDGAELKKKWKNLRDTYAKYLKSNNSHSGAKKNYKHWQWALQMEAFRPFLKFSKTTINVVDDTNSSEGVESNYEEIKQETPVQRKEFECHEQDPHPDAVVLQESRKRKLRQRKHKEDVSSVGAVLDYLKKKRSRPSPEAVDLIFHGYAQTLKQFSPKRQAEVKIKIATIMAEAELQHQEEELLPSRTSEYRLDTSTSNYSNTSEGTPSNQQTQGTYSRFRF